MMEAMVQDAKAEAARYKVSVEYYHAVKEWNRQNPAAKNKDFLDKIDKYHLSCNLSGEKRIRNVESIMNLLGISIRGRRFLDLGCGTGGTVMAARNTGAAYCEGWEINDDKIRFANINVACISGRENGSEIRIINRAMDDPLSLAGDEELFKVIVCDQVLEHVKDLNQAARTIAKCLDSIEGFAFVSIPNGFSVASVIKDQHLLVFGLTLLDRFEGAPVAEGVKGHNGYSRMMGEYKHYGDYVSLFKKNGLSCLPLHSVVLNFETLFSLKEKISEIRRLKDEVLPKWRELVPEQTLSLLDERISDYVEDAESRIMESTGSLKHGREFAELLVDYWLDTYDFLVFHSENESMRNFFPACFETAS